MFNRGIFLLSALLGLSSSFCLSQTGAVVCSDGTGKFEVRFRTGVTVSVGAARNGELATRACRATFSWDKQDLIAVPEAAEVDIDVLGADLGLHIPVVAFQVKKSSADWGVDYQIYSLQKPPRLLRTITGGDFFRAADTDLQGRIEIWSSDASILNGFENLHLSELDFAPNIVLRFEEHRLVDVSSEFRPHFDSQILGLRAQLDPQQLSNFKNSDGKLSAISSLPAEQLHRLRATKIKVLEIVWSYLYSGREQDAWSNLAEMWPPADVERIRSSLLSVRDHGIRSQIDSVSKRTIRDMKPTVPIYDIPPDQHAATTVIGGFVADTKPQAILLLRPPPTNQQQGLPKSTEMVELVIDAAGKVGSAKTSKGADPNIIPASANWKFIPAYKNGHPVVSRMRMALWYLE